MDTSPSERIDVPISYEDDVLSVYWEIATSILRHDRTLDILSHPPLLGSLNRSALPSWVPDWSKSTSLDMAHRWELGPLSLAERELSAKIGLVQPFALVAAPLGHAGVLVYQVGCALRCRGTVSIVASIVRISGSWPSCPLR
jgi:hypothetical protein